ncbi:MAG: hypothetical protein ABL886_12935, partial [Rhodoglobus sp.]
MSRPTTTLTELAKLGFAGLDESSERLSELGIPELVPLFASAADPDQALRLIVALRDCAPKDVSALLANADAAARLIRVLGASSGLGDFLLRHPDAV